MRIKCIGLALTGFLCLCAGVSGQTAKKAPIRNARQGLNRAPAPQPNSPPCQFRFTGRWFGSNRVVYEIRNEGDDISWSAPALQEVAGGNCRGARVTASWTGAAGPGDANGAAEGTAEGVATMIRWNNAITFYRVPEMRIEAERNPVNKGEEAQFFAVIIPPDIPDRRYFINFGDGTEEFYNKTSARHVYRDRGIFDVVLTTVVDDEKFTSPPLRMRVEEGAPMLRLEVDPLQLHIGEVATLNAILEPFLPGAEYQFVYAGQPSPWMASSTYQIRFRREGNWNIRVSARIGGPNPQAIDSLPVTVSVINNFQSDPRPSPPLPVTCLIPPVLIAGAWAGRRYYRDRKIRARVKFDRQIDLSRQQAKLEPKQLPRTELLFRPAADAGKQHFHHLSVIEERRGG